MNEFKGHGPETADFADNSRKIKKIINLTLKKLELRDPVTR